MPRPNPLFILLIMVSLAFLASQLLIYLLMYTSDILDELDIFRSLTMGFQSLNMNTCKNGDCSNEETGEKLMHQYDDSHRPCNPGYFQLNQDGICHPMLTCHDIDNIFVIKQVGHGAVKQVYLAKWKDYKVILSNLSHPSFKDDFVHGAEMLQQFQSSDLVVQLIGYCSSIPAIVTEYHSPGSLENVDRILKDRNEDNVVTRFRLCLDYVRIINFVHSSPAGTRVMCDSNDLAKTLSQFLVTSDLHLVINDLDALPFVDSSNGLLITCGHREIQGVFVAPEQLWPYPGFEFKEEQMPGYDEKTDIWKIPSVVDYLLGEDVHGDIIRFNLFKLHSRCRSKEPELRPTSAEVLDGYLEVQKTLKL